VLESSTPAPPADPTWPPPVDPARAHYLRTALVRIAASLLEAFMADLQKGSGSSTASPSDQASLSLGERVMVAALRPWIPQLRATLLTKLGEAEPAELERLMGATATLLESLLAQAPGDPLPRWIFRWSAGDPGPHLERWES
jgi:hypothetical protein